MKRAILFDLDGTLADTAPDLGWALNALLAEHGLPAQPAAAIRMRASHGARGLIELGFGITPAHSDFASLRQRYLALYDTHFNVDTRLFDGIDSMIGALDQAGFIWGIITNKPMAFTDRLVPALGFSIAPAVVVSGDTAGHPKPNPAPMLYATRALDIAATACVYVGDAERDMTAGHAVGMKTVLVNWGYISDSDQPQHWGADHRIDHPQQLLSIVETYLT